MWAWGSEPQQLPAYSLLPLPQERTLLSLCFCPCPPYFIFCITVHFSYLDWHPCLLVKVERMQQIPPHGNKVPTLAFFFPWDGVQEAKGRVRIFINNQQ